MKKIQKFTTLVGKELNDRNKLDWIHIATCLWQTDSAIGRSSIQQARKSATAKQQAFEIKYQINFFLFHVSLFIYLFWLQMYIHSPVLRTGFVQSPHIGKTSLILNNTTEQLANSQN